MVPAQALDPLGADVEPGFAQKLVGEQTAAHSDLAVDAPDGQFDALGIQRFLPRQDMLIHAVDERSVKIEQKHRLNTHQVSSWQSYRCEPREDAARVLLGVFNSEFKFRMMARSSGSLTALAAASGLNHLVRR